MTNSLKSRRTDHETLPPETRGYRVGHRVRHEAKQTRSTSEIAHTALSDPQPAGKSYLGECTPLGGTSECYAIKDADKRAYCLAQVRRDPGNCYRIKDGDNRNQCLAEIKGSRDRCYAIKNRDDRTACLAVTK